MEDIEAPVELERAKTTLDSKNKVRPQSELRNQLPASAYLEDNDDTGYGCCSWFIIILSGILFAFIFPIALLFSFKTVQEYERGVILRLGKCMRKHGKSVIVKPGLQFILPCTDKLMKASLRTQSFNILPQEVLTKDSVTCHVDAVVFLRIVDPAKALLRVENALQSAQYVAVSSLRSIIGQFDLSDLMQDRTKVDDKLQELMDHATESWGIVIERVDIKDVSLPADMQRAMAAEAEAVREAKAKIISAKGELDSSTALMEASQKFDKSPAALHLRYLQTLNTIAAEKNSTIIFPLPMEMMKIFGGK